jgi:deoxyribonuclease V
MLKFNLRHRWNCTPAQAVQWQRELAGRVVVRPLAATPRLVAGADCSFPDDDHILAGWVVWDVKHRRVVEQLVVRRRVTFPYVPGLLSFREAPALLLAAKKLQTTPDVLLFDGHGLAHPRRFGIACHVGLVLGLPSVGCAKRRLCGEHRDPPKRRGAQVPLIDRDEKIGRVLRTQTGLKPVYVSVGHLIDADDAVKVVMNCCTKYRLPEPTRLAHQLVTDAKETTPHCE